jgi:hypothetical protein
MYLLTRRKNISGTFRECSSVFNYQKATKEDVIAGDNALVVLYNGKAEDSLNNLRLSKFFQKVASSDKYASPENLPPTTEAANTIAFECTTK